MGKKYKNIFEGKFNPQNYKGRQSGGGIAGMYSKKPYMIPVNPHIPVKESKEVICKRVTPMEAVEERAKENLREKIRQNVPHVSASSIKVDKDLKSISPLSFAKMRTRKKALPKSLHTVRNNTTEETNLKDNIFTPKRARI
jgi:hypothetical protein